eukprot:8480920-Pyramimonas_sp.AAC.1
MSCVAMFCSEIGRQGGVLRGLLGGHGQAMFILTKGLFGRPEGGQGPRIWRLTSAPAGGEGRVENDKN